MALRTGDVDGAVDAAGELLHLGVGLGGGDDGLVVRVRRMTLVGEFQKNGCSRGDMRTLVTLLSPFAPHVAEELWGLGHFLAALAQNHAVAGALLVGLLGGRHADVVQELVPEPGVEQVQGCSDSLDYTPANEAAVHKTIKKVADDIEAMKFR